jgi:hypothetical protein
VSIVNAIIVAAENALQSRARLVLNGFIFCFLLSFIFIYGIRIGAVQHGQQVSIGVPK